MSLTLRLLLKSLPFFVSICSFSQTNPAKGCKPPKSHELWHDRIDKEQKNALKTFQAGNNDDVNYYVTQALTTRIDAIQCAIEKDSLIKDQQKVGYLRGVEDLLKNFTSQYRSRQFNAARLPAALEAYEAAMAKDERGETIENIVDGSAYEIGNLLITNIAFRNNNGLKPSQNSLLRKYLHLHPDKIFVKLKDNPDVAFRDSFIRLAAYQYPKRLYDFAAANDRLGNAIKNIDDPLIKAISRMARSGGSGQILFPFLDEIMNGKITDEEIKAVKDDDAKYYQLLVKTRMDYVTQTLNGEKIVSINDLDAMLQTKARNYFIKEINALHESPDAVRFTILNQLNAQELYYLVVDGESDLYTSSYVKGIYPQMMKKAHNRGDSLLMSVSFDKFKKFIRIAAGYNTLSDFLASFPDKDKAQVLMKGFVNNLERSTGLEDGVDVADSYASIAETIKPAAEEMLQNVKENYNRTVKDNNKRGMVMYNLLYKLFLSADSTQNIDLSKEFGIPPVYSVSYQSLTNDSNKVVMQVFFYGDKDGKMNWDGFIPQFINANWKKLEDNKYWLAFSSTKGKPIIVYANKWFDDEKQPAELDKAQEALNNYLDEKGIQPTIVVHRGHSYWAPYTIAQIKPTAKIVFLGSCGGYNLIHDVLKHASDAHIIASKQTGKKDINQPFMNILNEKLRTGSNIDWIPFWDEFKNKAGKIDGFEDYIPPYKNLGAIFIKAYNRAMGEDN